MGHAQELCRCGSTPAPKHRSIAALRNAFYDTVATIIRDNPSKTYETLTREYGFTPWTVKMAVKLNNIKRTRGRKAAA